MDRRQELVDQTIEQFLFWDAVNHNPDLYEGDFPEDWDDWESWSKEELNDAISMYAYEAMKSVRLEYYRLMSENLVQWDGERHLVAGKTWHQDGLDHERHLQTEQT